jgi:hypothetical protein
VRDIVIFGVNTCPGCAVTVVLEFFGHAVPRRAADVFEDHQGRSVVSYPGHHPAEGTPRFAVGVYVLFFVVQVGVVDAGRASDQKVNITRNGLKGSVGRGPKSGIVSI